MEETINKMNKSDIVYASRLDVLSHPVPDFTRMGEFCATEFESFKLKHPEMNGDNFRCHMSYDPNMREWRMQFVVFRDSY